MLVFLTLCVLKTSEMKLKLAQTINELRGTITDLNAELASRQSAEARTLSERSSLMLQLETLNDQLVRSSKQTEDWESDANRLAQVWSGAILYVASWISILFPW